MRVVIWISFMTRWCRSLPEVGLGIGIYVTSALA
jgi:hypothetical protein